MRQSRHQPSKAFSWGRGTREIEGERATNGRLRGAPLWISCLSYNCMMSRYYFRVQTSVFILITPQDNTEAGT